MIELLVEDLFAIAFAAGGIKSGQQEHRIHAVGLGSLDPFGLLRAVTRQRQEYRIARLRAVDELLESHQQGPACRRRIDHDAQVGDAKAAQRVFDIARICRRTAQPRNIKVIVDADDQRPDRAGARKRRLGPRAMQGRQRQEHRGTSKDGKFAFHDRAALAAPVAGLGGTMGAFL